jgi:hypothetical protein
MGIVTNHSDTVRQILTRVAEHLKRLPKPEVETLLIEDPTQGVFMLRRLGWHAGQRVDNTVIFARVRDGKVWIEEDNTDLSFYDELARAGIPKSDIVLAFQPPELRHLTEFAVA